jgi:hypothetical protein
MPTLAHELETAWDHPPFGLASGTRARAAKSVAQGGWEWEGDSDEDRSMRLAGPGYGDQQGKLGVRQ